MSDDSAAKGFAAQHDVRGPWRRFIDDLAPLRPSLFRYCCGLTGNMWDGEDLLQDVLLRVFGQLGKTHVELTHPRSYLIRTATNLWMDRVRHVRLEQSYITAELAEPEPAQISASQIVDLRHAANELFLYLPPQERAALLLSHVLDLSLEETASMLKTTTGAVKSALHRGRTRLKTAHAVVTPASTIPRAVLDRFVRALTQRDYEAIRELCLADVTVDMVGGATFDGFQSGKITLEYAHFVSPDLGFGEHPRWAVADYLGEPIAVGFRTLNGVEGLNEIWRFDMGDGGIARLRLYCFSPDVLAAVAQDLGVPALMRPYRSPN